MTKLSKKLRKIKGHPFCSAVVVAAGSSERMGEDKLMMKLGNMPVIAHTLRALESCECIDEIIVVTMREKIVDIAKICRDYGIIKATKIVNGGATRAESSLAGVSEASDKAKLIAIHDGARPLVTAEVVEAAVHAAVLHMAAVPAIRLKDTVKLAEAGMVVSTPDRDYIVAVQTPQVFAADIIKGALTNAVQKELTVTDDCSAAEAIGIKAHLAVGSEENIKITTPLDIKLAEAILESRR